MRAHMIRKLVAATRHGPSSPSTLRLRDLESCPPWTYLLLSCNLITDLPHCKSSLNRGASKESHHGIRT